MRETNKYLRRKTKPEIQHSEKTHRPRPQKKKLKHPKKSLQRWIDGIEEADIYEEADTY